MAKANLVQQIEGELIDANRAASFWRNQLQNYQDDPLESTVEENLQRAVDTIIRLQEARTIVSSRSSQTREMLIAIADT